jgi:hypothetical protein
MNRDEAVTELCRFIMEQGGEVEEITPEKLQDRAEIIEDPERPNGIVFTLERHHGIMGASYRRGYGNGPGPTARHHAGAPAILVGVIVIRSRLHKELFNPNHPTTHHRHTSRHSVSQSLI